MQKPTSQVFFRNVTTISTLRTRSTQKEVNSSMKAKHKKSKRFSFDNVRKPTIKSPICQPCNTARSTLTPVFSLTMLTAYTLTLIVPKHWIILLACLFLRYKVFYCNSRNLLEFPQLVYTTDLQQQQLNLKVPLFCQQY